MSNESVRSGSSHWSRPGHPTVSVVVPNYNGGDLFRDCVRSLAGLEYEPGRLEVFVVDDGSTDGSAEWLESESWPDFQRPLVQGVNRGRARARNIGLDHATGEIVVLLDGDLVVEPDFVRRHVEAQSRPGVSTVVGRVVAHPDAATGRLARYLHEYAARGAKQYGENDPVPGQYVLTGNLSVRRDLLTDVGGFDEEFDGYGGEDTLLGLRIEERDPHGIRYSADAVALDPDPHELADLLRKFGHYGRHNLARLVELYPEATERLHADWVVGPTSKRVKGELLFNAPLFWLVRNTLPVVPYPLSNYAIRYLLGASVVRGFREHQRAERRAA